MTYNAVKEPPKAFAIVAAVRTIFALEGEDDRHARI